MKHKPWTLPDIDLSHDEGDQRWHEAGGKKLTPVYQEDGVTVRHYTWNGLEPGHYASYYKLCVADSWRKTVRRYENNPDDTCNAYWYVDNHPVFWMFEKEINKDYPENHVSHLVHEGTFAEGWPRIIPHKVNPKTGRISRDKKKNTKISWWYEFGPTDLYGDCKSLDWELEGTADSYEQAVLITARKIHKYYGNDRTLVDLGNEYWSNRKVKNVPGGWGEILKEIRGSKPR